MWEIGFKCAWVCVNDISAGEFMNRSDSLGYYLKGALAGKLIDSPANVGECRHCSKGADSDSAIFVQAPGEVSAGESVNVCVRINNFLERTGKGCVVLQGEDLERGTNYYFHASFNMDQDCDGTCVTFRWRAPVHATQIKWSTTIQFDKKMGIGVPDCTRMTTVFPPLH